MRIQRGSIGARWLLALASTFLSGGNWANGSLSSNAQAGEVDFLVKPYLQLGDAPAGRVARDLSLLWHTDDIEADWAVEYQPKPDAAWGGAEAPIPRRIAVPSIAPHRVYQAVLKDLEPGNSFKYRVRKGANIVFMAEARAPKTANQPYRFVAFGDCGAATAEQKAIAYQANLAHPDFVMITGDIVYERGRISEYREKFWPFYNAEEASPLLGAPLLRSTLFVAAPGNHDIAARSLEAYPDGLAYFLYWAQPRNGPAGNPSGASRPSLTGPEPNRQAFLAAAAGTYPRMANFSFEFGNAHWLVLDSNPYVDWTNPEIRAWIDHDLAAARSATWRFVAFHHPGFNSSKAHFNDQQMRMPADLFEAHEVDVVFSGHVHNYQRTFPLRFKAERGPDGMPVRERDRVPGHWTLDTRFDGNRETRPQGVIYVITGAGGNRLYNTEQQDDPRSWQPFTQRFISKVHSLTVADVDGAVLTVRQLGTDGQELDRFVVTK